MGFLKNTIHRAEDLVDALRNQVPLLVLSVTDDEGLLAHCDINVLDAVNELAGVPPFYYLIRTWIADADFSEPDAQIDFSVGVGEQMYEHEANADYTAIVPGGAGLSTIRMDIRAIVAKTVYVMAEIDGRIYSDSGLVTD